MTTTQYPQLVFLSGPQAGQRVVLATVQAVLGRGGGADVPLEEEFTSRQHARYEVLAAGPTLENVSPMGTFINAKRYKAGKKILLATGDLIGVGSETEILFVSAGDDADAAVAALLSGPTRRNAFGKIVPTAAPAEETTAAPRDLLPQRESTRDSTQAQEVYRKPSEMTAGERETVAAKERRKKLLVGLGVWWGAMVVGGVLLAIFSGPPRSSERPIPRIIGQANAGQTEIGLVPLLEDIVQELRNTLAQIPKLAVNPAERDLWLQKAVDTYRKGGQDVSSRLETLQAFKRAMAYSGLSYLEASRALNLSQGDLTKMYDEVLAGVAGQLAARYHAACLAERDLEWKEAEKDFRELLDILPANTAAYPPGKSIYENVRLHHDRIKAYMTSIKKKGPLGI